MFAHVGEQADVEPTERMYLVGHAMLGDDQRLRNLADDILRDLGGATADANLDDRAVELREPDHRLGERLRERAQALGVRVDDRDAAHHVAGEAGQAIGGAVDQVIRVIVARQAELGAPRECALDAPAEQGAIDLGEAIGGRREHAQLAVLGIGDRDADLGTAIILDLDVLSRLEADLVRAMKVGIPTAARDERR